MIEIGHTKTIITKILKVENEMSQLENEKLKSRIFKRGKQDISIKNRKLKSQI